MNDTLLDWSTSIIAIWIASSMRRMKQVSIAPATSQQEMPQCMTTTILVSLCLPCHLLLPSAASAEHNTATLLFQQQRNKYISIYLDIKGWIYLYLILEISDIKIFTYPDNILVTIGRAPWYKSQTCVLLQGRTSRRGVTILLTLVPFRVTCSLVVLPQFVPAIDQIVSCSFGNGQISSFHNPPPPRLVQSRGHILCREYSKEY